MAPTRILVVANRTAGSAELIAALSERSARATARITLLVPATPRGLAWAADMKSGEPAARERAAAAVERMRTAGLEVESTVIGDPDPAAAVGDQLRVGGYDEIFVATLPAGVSRWLRLSLPHRIRRMTQLPLFHVTAAEAPSSTDRAAAAPTTGAAGRSVGGAFES